MRWLLVAAGLVSTSAFAEVDPRCADLPKPDDYDEQVQMDFQSNAFALMGSNSALHGAIPHEPGHGSLGVDVKVMPPLACEKRFVLDWTKTEDTNKSPILPVITASYAFPAIKNIAVPYAGFSFLPAIPLNGTRNLVLSGEVGIGFKAHRFFEVGARFHSTLQRTYGDIATAFDPENEPVVEDVYTASTWGLDAVMSVPVEVNDQKLSPYLAVGYLDASTFFFVGDSNYAANNLHPYAGPALSVGLDMLLAKRLRLGAELYTAPGGYSTPDETATSVERGARYGNLTTARFRIGVEL